MPASKSSSVARLKTYDPVSDKLNVIIETPQDSRNKYKYDDASGLFMLNAVLPDGAVFPYDFGFIPGTRGQDGDPLDVLVLMDQPAFTGCLLRARLIGVIEGDQTEKGKTERNDRLIAVAAESRDHRDIHKLGQVSANLVDEIESFFVTHLALTGKTFKPLGRFGPKRARALVETGRKKQSKGSRRGR